VSSASRGPSQTEDRPPTTSDPAAIANVLPNATALKLRSVATRGGRSIRARGAVSLHTSFVARERRTRYGAVSHAHIALMSDGKYVCPAPALVTSVVRYPSDVSWSYRGTIHARYSGSLSPAMK
jgi:hypothetical protein